MVVALEANKTHILLTLKSICVRNIIKQAFYIVCVR